MMITPGQMGGRDQRQIAGGTVHRQITNLPATSRTYISVLDEPIMTDAEGPLLPFSLRRESHEQ